jgi:nicotinamide-nucleotide amidase
MRNAEIIAVGSELLTADKIDTNSLFLTDQLNSLGMEVVRKQIIGDDRTLLTGAVREAVARVDLVILTGGLGPTEDDVTRDAVAAALGRTLVFRQDLCDALEERFRRFNRKMVENNRRQAFLVEGAEPLPNPRGTAAGQWIEHDGRLVLLLPGPPGELKAMFTEQCAPRLLQRLPPSVIRTRLYRVAGMPESDLDQLISPVYTKYQNPATTILAGAGDIQIHLRARCDSEEEALRLLVEVGGPIEELIGDRIYSTNGDSLEAVVGSRLRERGATLAVAESITGGLLAERITAVAGSSDYFVGGFLTYTNQMKTALVGVDPQLLRDQTAVSEEVARAMASGARERTGATFALSVTGEAGPESSTAATPGTVFIGFAGPEGVEARLFQFPAGDRNRVRIFAAGAALDYLRRKIK